MHASSNRFKIGDQADPMDFLALYLLFTTSYLLLATYYLLLTTCYLLQADPMDFLAWLLNALHTALGGTRKPGSSIIHRTFQGSVRVTTHKASADPEAADVESKEVPLLHLHNKSITYIAYKV